MLVEFERCRAALIGPTVFGGLLANRVQEAGVALVESCQVLFVQHLLCRLK